MQKVYAIYADKKSIEIYLQVMVFFGVLTPFVFSAILISVKFSSTYIKSVAGVYA